MRIAFHGVIVAAGVTLLAGSADAARLVVEYACADPRTYERLQATRSGASEALFHARLQRALASGHCRLARFAPPPAVVGAPPAAPARRIIRLTAVYATPRTTVVVVPPVARERSQVKRGNGRGHFPNPTTFAPVR